MNKLKIFRYALIFIFIILIIRLFIPHNLSSFIKSTSASTTCMLVRDNITHLDKVYLEYPDIQEISNLFGNVAIQYTGFNSTYFYVENGHPLYRFYFGDNDKDVGKFIINGQNVYVGLCRYKISQCDVTRIEEKLNTYFYEKPTDLINPS